MPYAIIKIIAYSEEDKLEDIKDFPVIEITNAKLIESIHRQKKLEDKELNVNKDL